jgi:hypothetical protein
MGRRLSDAGLQLEICLGRSMLEAIPAAPGSSAMPPDLEIEVCFLWLPWNIFAGQITFT